MTDQFTGPIAAEIHQRLTADVLGKLPRGCLVDPHQGSMEDEALLHAEVERYL